MTVHLIKRAPTLYPAYRPVGRYEDWIVVDSSEWVSCEVEWERRLDLYDNGWLFETK